MRRQRAGGGVNNGREYAERHAIDNIEATSGRASHV